MSRAALMVVVPSLVLLAGGCGDGRELSPEPETFGRHISVTELCELRLKVSTRQDVELLLGSPQLAGPTRDGTVLQYLFVERGSARESTLVWVDTNDVLQRIERVNVEFPACLEAAQ